MKYYFGFIPRGRVSSAYGYAQVLDGTWEHYKDKTKLSFASRTNFYDSVNFIGWYLDNVHKKIGISKNDVYNLYLVYHEGMGGFKRGSHEDNHTLKKYANKTSDIAEKYYAQLKDCNIPRKPLLSYIF